jgi:uroporphyrinogen decarboxylase
MYDLAAVVADISVREFCQHAEAMVKAQLALHEIVGQDVIAVGSDNYYIAEGFGCRTTTGEEEIPALDKPAAENLSDVFDLQVPDPTTDGRMPLMLEAIRLIRKAVGNEVAIRSPGTGPFALASHLLGSQAWLCEVGFAEAGMPEANEVALHHALDLATKALIRFGKACWDAGADIIHCGDSLASCDVISPRTYKRYAFPYQRRVFAAWKEHGITSSLLHICGNSTKALDAYANTGADIVEIDNKVDLGFAKEQIGGRVALMGNVHTVEHLLKGTVQCVHDASQRCIDQAGSGGGFILGSGCIVPRHTPIENVVEMVRVAHQQTYP